MSILDHSLHCVRCLVAAPSCLGRTTGFFFWYWPSEGAWYPKRRPESAGRRM